MIDIQTVACFNTHSPILHLFLPIQFQIHNSLNIFNSNYCMSVPILRLSQPLKLHSFLRKIITVGPFHLPNFYGKKPKATPNHEPPTKQQRYQVTQVAIYLSSHALHLSLPQNYLHVVFYFISCSGKFRKFWVNNLNLNQ